MKEGRELGRRELLSQGGSEVIFRIVMLWLLFDLVSLMGEAKI